MLLGKQLRRSRHHWSMWSNALGGKQHALLMQMQHAAVRKQLSHLIRHTLCLLALLRLLRLLRQSCQSSSKAPHGTATLGDRRALKLPQERMRSVRRVSERCSRSSARDPAASIWCVALCCGTGILRHVQSLVVL